MFGSTNAQAEDFGVQRVAIRTQPEMRPIHEHQSSNNKKNSRQWKRFKRNKPKDSLKATENGEEAEPENRKRKMQEAVSMESLDSINSHNSVKSTSTFSGSLARKKKRKPPINTLVLSQDFSFENLYNASIPTDLSAEETGVAIAKELGERDPVRKFV